MFIILQFLRTLAELQREEAGDAVSHSKYLLARLRATLPHSCYARMLAVLARCTGTERFFILLHENLLLTYNKKDN